MILQNGRMGLAAHPVDLSADIDTIAGAVDAACRDTGFLVLVGHGVPQPVVDAWVDGCTAFFDRPMADKLAYVVEQPEANRGYTPPGKEALAYTLGAETPPDLFEAMTYGRDDAVGPTFDANRHYFWPNEWPAEPPGLRDAFLAYEAELRRVADVVLRAMAR